MNKNNFAITAVVAVIVGALGFWGGMQYQKSRRGSFPGNIPQGFRNGFGQTQQTNGRSGSARQGGVRPVTGEISAMDDTTLTVKAQDGSSKIIVYSASTTVNKTSAGSISDLKVGEQVTVMGSETTDGPVTAQIISLGSDMFQGEKPPELPAQE